MVVLMVLPGMRASAASGSLESNLLFAGMDIAQVIPASALSAAALKGELVGIIVDGREVSMELVYRNGERFLLPAQLLGKMGIRGTSRAGRLFLTTPGGDVEAPRSYFEQIDGALFFKDTLLDEVLKIRWEFAPDRYAFNMTLPWWQKDLGPATDALTPEDLTGQVDVSPSAFGVTQLRLDHTHLSNKLVNSDITELLMRGRLSDGIWRAEVIAQDNRPTRAEDYYWLRDFEHVQGLVGNQQVSINPLLPAIETTGAQALFSSKEIEFDPYQDQTRGQFIRRFGIPTKDIEGVAQPGAIAELRINEKPIARTRVNLDGTYGFRRIRSNSLQFQTVTVRILDQRSLVELEVQDFTRTPIDLLLDDEQTVVFGGLGGNGNPLDELQKVTGESVFGLVRHGLTDRLTVEAGLQSASGVFHQTAGVTASLARNWATSLSLGHREGAFGHSFELYGRSERWQFTARSQLQEENFRGQRSPETTSNEIRYEHWVRPNLSLGLHGRYRDTGNETFKFLLPGLNWRFNNRNIVRIWPDFEGEYRAEVRTIHRRRDWFEFVHDSAGDRAEYRFFRAQNHEIFGRLSRFSFDDSTVAEFGTVFYPNRFDDRSQIGGSVLGGSNGFGFRFLWQTTILPGLFSYLELRDNPVRTEFSDPGLQLRWTVSVDLAISGGRPIPARNDFIQGRLGSIGGRLTLPDGEPITSLGVDKVTVMLNGRAHTAVLRGRHFFLRNIRPGIYEVSLSAEHLPMMLSPRKTKYRVKVVPAATSTVDFIVQHEYGLLGQVLKEEGSGLGNVRVEARNADGELLHATLTDAYGYYQFSGFPPGEYQLSVVNGGETIVRRIEIVDSFVFDADFNFAEAGTGFALEDREDYEKESRASSP
ncbi:MAG: carboxypeptidase-like regulatory domain-containing protein [Pseudomonadota bacterium]